MQRIVYILSCLPSAIRLVLFVHVTDIVISLSCVLGLVQSRASSPTSAEVYTYSSCIISLSVYISHSAILIMNYAVDFFAYLIPWGKGIDRGLL